MAFLSELFRISNSNSFGLVLNLYRDDTMNLLIGALLLNPEDRLSEGAKVSTMPRLASILLEDFAIGSILDALGNLVLNEDRVDVQYRWVIESAAPGIIDRQSPFEPFQTGVLFINSMIPLARGKPDLIFTIFTILALSRFSQFSFFMILTIFDFSAFSRFLIFHDFSFLIFHDFHDFDFSRFLFFTILAFSFLRFSLFQDFHDFDFLTIFTFHDFHFFTF